MLEAKQDILVLLIYKYFNSPDHHRELMLSIGGLDYTKQPAQPTKSIYTFDGEAWKSGIVSDLPEALAWQCLVKLDDDDLLAVGGFDELYGAGTSTYFYRGSKNVWIKGPSMRVRR